MSSALVCTNFLPPEGAVFLERIAFTKRPTFNMVQTLRGATNHYPLITDTCNLKIRANEGRIRARSDYAECSRIWAKPNLKPANYYRLLMLGNFFDCTIFIILRMSSNCFNKRFTSCMSLPLPLAMRCLRLALSTCGFLRS